MEYNEAQQRAISCQNEVVILPAGPGSGKSHTLVGRVVQSVRNGADPSRICILTFTNNAARVFADRLESAGIERLHYMGTLHGYCMRLVQDHGSLLGYRAGTVSIVTEEARWLLIEQVKSDLKKKISDRELKECVTADARLIMAEYRFRLKRSNMIDHDGILRDGLALLKKKSVKYWLPFAELLVDERQDSGAIDSEIFWEIPAERRFFVGDVDQCIYGFRGARPDLFVQEAEKHGFIALELNYRSDTAICEAANKLISHNTNRIPKRIKPVSMDEGRVRVRSFEHEGDEIYGIWSKIREEQENRVPLSQIAVLARTNAIAAKYRDALRGLGLQVATQISVADRRGFTPDWHLALSVIALMIDPANDFHAEAIMRSCLGQMGPSVHEIADLKLKAAREGVPLAVAANMERPAANETLDLALWRVSRYVTRTTMDLIIERSKQLPPDATLSDLLVDLWHPEGWRDAPNNPNAAYLVVSTIHGAKGSEWDVVFIVGMEEGVFPHLSSNAAIKQRGVGPTVDEIEEERRLCFVAVTRAKHRLYMTWAKKRVEYFKTVHKVRSRFIDECGCES